MNRLRTLLIAAVMAFLAGGFLTLTAPGRAFAQNVPCYFDQGGALFHIGSYAGATCTMQVENGGVVKTTANGGAQLTDVVLGGGAAGSATSDRFLTKTVTGIADATATTVLTVTVPNAAHSATIPIVINGSIGAGGAVGADECTATAYGQVVLTRTAGLATVATATTLADTGSACVAGATTITLAYSVTSMTGANSATQTFNIQVTITKGGGASANHIAVVEADVLNANASGVTVS